VVDAGGRDDHVDSPTDTARGSSARSIRGLPPGALAGGSLHQALDVELVADVRPEGRDRAVGVARVVGDLVEVLDRSRAGDHVGSLVGEPARHRRADPPARTRDDDCPVHTTASAGGRKAVSLQESRTTSSAAARAGRTAVGVCGDLAVITAVVPRSHPGRRQLVERAGEIDRHTRVFPAFRPFGPT
jgi:hypothetical protein